MDPVALLKALLLQAAYQGACAVCEPLIKNPDGTQVAIDPLIQDTGLRQKGLLVYEEAKVQYAAIIRAWQDKTGIWPDPTLPTPAVKSAVGGDNFAGVAKAIASVIPGPGAEIANAVAGAVGAVTNPTK